jgi:hypothetical protein
MYNIQYWLLSDTKAPTERENGWISTPDQDHDYPPRGEAAQAFQSGWSLGCACKWAIRQRCVADRAWMAEGGSAEYLFAPYQSAPSNSEIATPDYIYAADPSGETHRPCETVTPLAAWLNYAQGSAQFNVSYSVGGGEPDLVKSVLARSGVVLICWEHDNIMPNIVGRINDSKYPIANYSAIPNAWPDVFYLVWVFDLNGSSYTWTSVNQNLVAGDVQS